MRDKERIFFFLLFVLFPLALFWRGFLPGNIISAQDLTTVDLPFRMFGQEAFLKFHRLPMWMPGILAGIPFLDAPNQGFFYPPEFIPMALNVPVYYTYSFDFILHMLIGAFGAFLFLKTTVRESWAAVFGAFAYMSSGIFASFIAAGHIGNFDAAAYLPLVFFFFRKGFDDGKAAWYLSAGLCLAMQELVNGTQVMVYTFIAAAAYISYLWLASGRLKKEWPKAAGLLALVPVSAALFSAPQLFAAVKYLGHSWRPAADYNYLTSYSFDPLKLVTFVLPKFFGVVDFDYLERARNTYYMGLIPLLLAPFSFVKGKQRPAAIFFGISAAVSLLLSLGRYTPLYRLAAMIPVINSFRVPSRFLYIFTLLMAGLAAIGLSNIISGDEKEKIKKTMAGCLAVAAVFYVTAVTLVLTGAMSSAVYSLFLANMGKWMADDWHSRVMRYINADLASFAVIASVFFAAVYLKLSGRIKHTWVLLLILCAAQFGDAYRVEREFIRYVPASNVLQNSYPAARLLESGRPLYRVTVSGQDQFPNMNMLFGIESLSGYHGMEQAEMARLKQNGSFDNPAIARMLNVRYHIVPWSPGRQGAVYEDGKYLARFYLADSVTVLKDEEAVFKYINSTAFKPGQAVMAGKGPAIPTSGSGRVDVIRYEPDRITLSVDSKSGGLLVASNYYYESWKARVNKEPSAIYKVNYALSGVRVPAGKSLVTLYFDGWYVYAGLFTALAALTGFAAVLFARKKIKQGN